MHYRTTHLRPTLLALGLGLLAAGPVRAQSSQTAPLAGLWRLNPDLSDHMEDKLQNARRPGAYTGMAGGGRHGGGGGGRGGGGHGMRREGREGGLEGEELGNLIHPILQILIRQDDSTVALSDAAGQMQTFYLDGRKVKEPLLTGGDLETVAKWKDAKLTIERKHMAPNGYLHAGTVVGFADSVAGYGCILNLPEGATGTTTLTSTTSFLRGLAGGQAHATSRPLHRGRSTIVVETEVVDDDGRLLGKVTQTQAVLRTA